MSILVNAEKVVRAQEILDYINNDKRPQSENEVERRDKFTTILAGANVDPKSKGALQFVYEKLGGLVRSESEQKAHDVKVAPLRAKSRRKKAE